MLKARGPVIMNHRVDTDTMFSDTHAVCDDVGCRVLSLQSGLSEPDKEENKPTSDSDDGYSKDLVISFLICSER